MTLTQLRQLQLITTFLIHNYGEEKASRILQEEFLNKIETNLPFYAYYKNKKNGTRTYHWVTENCEQAFKKGKKVLLSNHSNKFDAEKPQHQIAVVFELLARMSENVFHYTQKHQNEMDNIQTKKGELEEIVGKAYENLLECTKKLDKELKYNHRQELKREQASRKTSAKKKNRKEKHKIQDNDESNSRYHPLPLIPESSVTYRSARFYAQLRDSVLKNFSFARGARLRGALRELDKEFLVSFKQRDEYVDLSGALFLILDIEDMEEDIVTSAFEIIRFLKEHEQTATQEQDKKAIACYKTAYFQVIHECIEHLAKEGKGNILETISDIVGKKFQIHLDSKYGTVPEYRNQQKALEAQQQESLFNSFKGNPDFPCINPSLYINQDGNQKKKLPGSELPKAVVLANSLNLPLGQYQNAVARKPRRWFRSFTRAARAENDDTKRQQASNMISFVNKKLKKNNPSLQDLTQVVFKLNQRAFQVQHVEDKEKLSLASTREVWPGNPTASKPKSSLNQSYQQAIQSVQNYIHQNASTMESLLSANGKEAYKKNKDALYYAMNTVTNEALIQKFNQNYTEKLSSWTNKRPFYNRAWDQDRKNFAYNLLTLLKNCRTAEDYTNFLVVLQRAIAKYTNLGKLPQGQGLIHPRDNQLVKVLTQLFQRILEEHVFGITMSAINSQGGWRKPPFNPKMFNHNNRFRLEYSAEQITRIRGILPVLQANKRSNLALIQACEKFFAWHKENTPLQEQMISSNGESSVNETLFEAAENYSGRLSNRSKVIMFRNKLRQKLNANLLVDLINTTGRVEMKPSNIALGGSVANMIISNIPFPGARLTGGVVENAAGWYEEKRNDQNAENALENSGANGFSEIELLGNKLAETLANMFDEQIQDMQPEDVSRFAEFLFNRIHSGLQKGGHEEIHESYRENNFLLALHYALTERNGFLGRRTHFTPLHPKDGFNNYTFEGLIQNAAIVLGEKADEKVFNASSSRKNKVKQKSTVGSYQQIFVTFAGIDANQQGKTAKYGLAYVPESAFLPEVKTENKKGYQANSSEIATTFFEDLHKYKVNNSRKTDNQNILELDTMGPINTTVQVLNALKAN